MRFFVIANNTNKADPEPMIAQLEKALALVSVDKDAA